MRISRYAGVPAVPLVSGLRRSAVRKSGCTLTPRIRISPGRIAAVTQTDALRWADEHRVINAEVASLTAPLGCT